MRPPIAAGTVAGVLLLSAAAFVGGRSLEQPSLTIGPDDLPAEMAVSEDAELEADTVAEGGIEASTPAADDDVAGPTGLERVAPREPLSELSLALPPKPKKPDEWEGTILHRAVAPSAGILEAMGYRVAIAGIESIAADATCEYQGSTWDCGIHARTAFRALLRGRSPTCAVPPEPDREILAANCRIGKLDLGEWLVSNGWARAAHGGPYEAAGAKAEADGLGLFGPAPSRDVPGLPRSSPPIDATVRDAPSIEILAEPEEGARSSFETLTLPADPPAPSQ